MKYTIAFILALILSVSANAQLSIYTQHQAISMFSHGTNNNQDVQFPTGKVPYIGQVGLDYKINNYVSTQVGYIHRSNIDLTNQNEYNYNGVFIGFKLEHCVYWC